MPDSLRRILLATDGSEGAAPAARAATHLSNRTAAELHLVHVWKPVPHPPVPSPTFDDLSRSAREEARELLRREEWKAKFAGGRVAGKHLREGPPAGEILALAEHLGADLIIVGRRAGRVRRLMTGSVSGRVARGAPCPVLVVRGDAWPPKRVVVADEAFERAGVLSAEIAGVSGAELVLVRGYEHPPVPVGGWSARDRRELDQMFLWNRRELQRRAEQLEERARCRPKTRLVKANAASALDGIAEESGEGQALLAVGSRRPGGASNAVLRGSKGPVLVVPARAPVARRADVTDRGVRPRDREHTTRTLRSPVASRIVRPYATWWLLSREGGSGTDLLTVSGADGKVLPAFSHEEEAHVFLWLGAMSGGSWRVRETAAGELASLLLGPCAHLDSVALDPLPGMTEAGTLDLVKVDRERFVGLLVSRANVRHGPDSRRSHGPARQGTPRTRPPNRRPL